MKNRKKLIIGAVVVVVVAAVIGHLARRAREARADVALHGGVEGVAAHDVQLRGGCKA